MNTSLVENSLQVSARYFTLQRVVLFISLISINLVLCSRSSDTLEEQRRRAGIKSLAEEVRSNASVTFVELGSVNCIPCRMMQPVMKEIETAYAGKVKVVFIDVLTDQGRPYLEKLGIKAIPTQVFLDAHGKELARHTGYYPKDSIVALLANKGVK
jgi:thioredoxin 1